MFIWLSGPNRYRPIISGTSLWEEIEHGILASAIIAFFAYLCQLLFKKPIFSLILRKVLICNKCYEVKYPNGRQSCDCGGILEDFRHGNGSRIEIDRIGTKTQCIGQTIFPPLRSKISNSAPICCIGCGSFFSCRDFWKSRRRFFRRIRWSIGILIRFALRSISYLHSPHPRPLSPKGEGRFANDTGCKLRRSSA